MNTKSGGDMKNINSIIDNMFDDLGIGKNPKTNKPNKILQKKDNKIITESKITNKTNIKSINKINLNELLEEGNKSDGPEDKDDDVESSNTVDITSELGSINNHSDKNDYQNKIDADYKKSMLNDKG